MSGRTHIYGFSCGRVLRTLNPLRGLACAETGVSGNQAGWNQ